MKIFLNTTDIKNPTIEIEKTTKLWVVLNEETLTIARENTRAKAPAKFHTEKQANNWASERLNMWVAVKVHFNHKWLQHKVDDKFIENKVTANWGE
jgi:hypothetical protein